MATDKKPLPVDQGAPEQFASGEVRSTYGYVSGYNQANAAAEQFAVIKSFFPYAKSYDEALAAKDAPVGSEGNFLILPWQRVAPTYGEAVQVIVNKLFEQRGGKFDNFLEDRLGPYYLREGNKKIEVMKEIAAEQSNYDVLVISAQLGIRHRGKSIQRARLVIAANEFHLGAYEVGSILLTHQNRFQRFPDLRIDCAGDEFAPAAGGDFCHAPFFYFYRESLELNTRDFDSPNGHYGSASAFVPVVVPSE